MKFILTAFLIFYGVVAWAGSDTVPKTDDIIDALTPKPRLTLRNIGVKKTEVAAPTVAEPTVAEPTVAEPTVAEPTVAGPVPEVSRNEESSAASVERPNISLSILFEFNSSRITSESDVVLRNLASALTSPQLRDRKFLIEGHTDAKGGDAYNMKLSQQRADSVRTWLTKHGTSNNQLDSVGRGSQELADKANPYASENRRVKIVTVQ